MGASRTIVSQRTRGDDIGVAYRDLQNQELRQILHRVKCLEPVSPNVPSAAAKNQYRDDDDQKIGGVHSARCATAGLTDCSKLLRSRTSR